MAAVGVAGVLASACTPSGGGSTKTAAQGSGKPSLTVWADPLRLAMVQQYKAAHPEVDVTIDQIPADPAGLGQKLLLAAKAGQGWPDITAAGTQFVDEYNSAQYNFTADISAYVPKALLAKFAPNANTPCMVDGKLLCLRNDIAPDVLWYNAPLMKKFGYSVPTTWDAYEALGLRLAKEHSGYVAGMAGTASNDAVYFVGSGCLPFELVDKSTLRTNLPSSKCTRAADLMDSLLSVGAMSPGAATTPDAAKQYGTSDKWLMLPGPLFFQDKVFKDLYHMPAGSVDIAPPLKWQADDKIYNGSSGGLAWMVSRHSKYIKAAAQMATWLATGAPQLDGTSGTFPAYEPAETAFAKRVAQGSSSSLSSVEAAIDTATNTVVPQWSYLAIPNVGFAATVPAAIASGKSVRETLPAWQSRITQEAKAAGYKVVTAN